MEGSLVFLEIGGAQTVANHHIVAFEDLGNHGGRSVGGVGIVAVSHNVHVGVNVLEHGANYIALTLAGLLPDDCTFGSGDLGGAVSGVVIVHVDIGLGQCGLEVTHDLADSHFFVVAGQ